MGNKCCISATKRKIEPIVISPIPLQQTQRNEEQTLGEHDEPNNQQSGTTQNDGSGSKHSPKKIQIERVDSSSIINTNDLQQIVVISPVKMNDTKLPASPSSKGLIDIRKINEGQLINKEKLLQQSPQRYQQSKTLKVPLKVNNLRKSKDQTRENGKQTGNTLLELDVPYLKQSPTIRIDKEWIPKNAQNSLSYTQQAVQNATSSEQQLQEDESVLEDDTLIRKQSSLNGHSEKSLSPSSKKPPSLMNTNRFTLGPHSVQQPVLYSASNTLHQIDLSLNKSAYAKNQSQINDMSSKDQQKNDFSSHNITKHESINSHKDSEEMIESDDNTFSRANSFQNELQKGNTIRSQGKSTARFKINPISVAISSQHSMSPNNNNNQNSNTFNGRFSFGMKDNVQFHKVNSNTLQSQQQQVCGHDSFARVHSNGSTIKDIDEASSKKKQMTQSQNGNDDKGQNVMFETFVQGYLFGKPNTEDKILFDEMSSPVLGRKKSSKNELISQISSKGSKQSPVKEYDDINRAATFSLKLQQTKQNSNTQLEELKEQPSSTINQAYTSILRNNFYKKGGQVISSEKQLMCKDEEINQILNQMIHQEQEGGNSVMKNIIGEQIIEQPENEQSSMRSNQLTASSNSQSKQHKQTHFNFLHNTNNNLDASKRIFEPIKEERESPSTNKNKLDVNSNESPPRVQGLPIGFKIKDPAILRTIDSMKIEALTSPTNDNQIKNSNHMQFIFRTQKSLQTHSVTPSSMSNSIAQTPTGGVQLIQLQSSNTNIGDDQKDKNSMSVSGGGGFGMIGQIQSSQVKAMRQTDLIKPIKSLTKKLNNDYQKVEELITQRRQISLRNQLMKLQSNYKFVSQSNENLSLADTPTGKAGNSNNQFNNANYQESQTIEPIKFRDSSSLQMSPSLPVRKSTYELSPIAETVVISDDQIPLIMGAAGNGLEDGISDFCTTPNSDNKNTSYYLKSDVSVDYSILGIEYEEKKNGGGVSTSIQNLIIDERITPNSKTTPLEYSKPPFNKAHSEDQLAGKVGVGEGGGTGSSSGLNQQSQFQKILPPPKTFQSLTRDNLDQFDEKDKSPSQQQQQFNESAVNVTKSVISTKENGKKKINQYILVKNIGKGSFGKVKLALNTENHNKPCAIKIMSKKKLKRIFVGKNRTAMNDVMQEIAIMKKLDHENVVKLFEVLDDPQVDKLYIVMEYMKNGSLMQKLDKTKTLQMHNLWKFFRDIISGLHYLHECAGVVHRDLKPENLLLDEQDKVKISDFGVSFMIENGCDELTSTAGSNYFFAPEICSGQAYKGKKSDIWAIGVTLYYMIYKKYPFQAGNIPNLYNKIITLEPEFPPDSNQLLVDFLKRFFIKDPEKRISLQEIIQHDWVSCNGIQPLHIHISPSISISKRDTEEAIKKVQLIAKIQLKFRQRKQQQLKQIQTRNRGNSLHQSMNNSKNNHSTPSPLIRQKSQNMSSSNIICTQ